MSEHRTARQIALVAALGSASIAAADPPRFEVGSRFPQIVLPALADGRPMSLADFRGRKVILQVFASW